MVQQLHYDNLPLDAKGHDIGALRENARVGSPRFLYEIDQALSAGRVGYLLVDDLARCFLARHGMSDFPHFATTALAEITPKLPWADVSLATASSFGGIGGVCGCL